MSVAILVDSNSGVTTEEAKKVGIYTLPMPFYIDDKLYYEDVDLTRDEFFRLQEEGHEITTSMPLVGEVMDCWDKLLEEHDEVVYIPMSSGLSSSCSTAIMLSEEYDGRVVVVNNQRISVTQKLSAYEAKRMADEGKNAHEIQEYLERTKLDSSIYIMVDTLQYLKKGGRITPAVAAIGTLLRIKPVLQIQGDKLDRFAQARTLKQAKQVMMDAVVSDLKDRFHTPSGKGCVISIAHTQNQQEAETFREEVQAMYPDHQIIINPLPLSISCHIGPGALALTVTPSPIKIEEFE
ncbi:MAG: DegV family protein [Lachnospiraceae bacterium]|nr:DegV family protein [Lachnospiraceae bacterium]